MTPLPTPERALTEEYRFKLCEACGSEGRVYSVTYHRWTEPTEHDHGPCGACEGTGVACIEVEPITMEDLSDAGC